VPINENFHWYLAIIYEPEHALRRIEYDEADGAKNTPKCNHSKVHSDWTDACYRTYIFTFDSLGGKHTRVWDWLSSYLEMEARCKKGVDILSKVDGMTAVVWLVFFFSYALNPVTQVPLQPNSCDCGIYLLHFVRTFMSDPTKYANMILV
jgi:Ulp1 family protease